MKRAVAALACLGTLCVAGAAAADDWRWKRHHQPHFGFYTPQPHWRPYQPPPVVYYYWAPPQPYYFRPPPPVWYAPPARVFHPPHHGRGFGHSWR